MQIIVPGPQNASGVRSVLLPIVYIQGARDRKEKVELV